MTALSQDTLESLTAGEPAWLQTQRRTAWQAFTKLQYPTPRDFEWRRFNLRALRLDRITAAPAVTASISTLNDDATNAGVIFCDLGTAVRQYPDLVRTYLGKSLAPDEPRKFGALHSALWQGGVFAYVPRGVSVKEPLEITYSFQGNDVAAFPRSVIAVAPGAEATFIQRFVGGPAGGDDAALGLHASGTEVFAEEAAKLHYISLQNFAPGVFDFTQKRAHVARDAEVDWVLGMFGGSFMRYDVECAMEGPGGTSSMYGVGLGEARQQFGQFTKQHHKCGNTVSDLLFKNVYNDDATGVYSGIIRVEKNANGTNAYQANRNLVLSDKVKCDTRPLLEIESNDLRCTHGATVGRLDANQLFYLQARGLTTAQARELLIEAFLEPVLARIKVERVYNEFSKLIHNKVTKR